MGKSGLSCSFTDPQQMCRCVVVVTRSRINSGHCLFVRKQQAFVGRVEIDLLHGRRLKIDSNSVHEAQRFFDNRCQFSVLGSCWCGFNEIQCPSMQTRQIGVPTAGESTQNIQSLSALIVGFDHPVWVSLSGFGCEGELTVDVVTLVGRKSHAINCFCWARSWFRKLSRHTTNLDDWFGSTMRQNQRHLKNDSKGITNVIDGEFVKGFGTVATKENEGFSLRRKSQLIGQGSDFSGEDERCTFRQFFFNFFEGFLVRIFWNLFRFLLTPRRW
mmetsp:Transcript_18160/g.37441  ORF Transcript_18160/g.37441 Transcript_18160/m.37441 type:complete len:272 (+) Transcript_18160:746-1561(+)